MTRGPAALSIDVSGYLGQLGFAKARYAVLSGEAEK